MSSDTFATTRWTQVLAAQGANTQAGTALADSCIGYYAPVHAYIARTAHFELPPTAKTVRIAAGPFGAAGVIDFDDIEVEFK